MASEVEVKAGTRFQLLDEKGGVLPRVFEYSGSESDGAWFGTIMGRLARVKDRQVEQMDFRITATLGPQVGQAVALYSDLATHIDREVWVSNDGMNWQVRVLAGVCRRRGNGIKWILSSLDGFDEFAHCCIEEPLDKANERNAQVEKQVRVDLSYREACRRTMLNSSFIGKRSELPSYLEPGEQFDLQFAISEFVKEADSRIAEDKDDTIRRQFLRQVNVHMENEGFPRWHDTGTWECVYEAMRSLITGVTKRGR